MVSSLSRGVVDGDLTDKTDRKESSRKYGRPITNTMSNLTIPMMTPKGIRALRKSSLPGGDTSVRNGLNKRFL